MAIHKIEDLLKALAERGIERARPGLGQATISRLSAQGACRSGPRRWLIGNIRVTI